ncbi:hypothetical protein NBRC116494_15360 [Aurantivibrio plasticivorans]
MTRYKHVFAMFCWLLFTLDVMAAALPACSDMPVTTSDSDLSQHMSQQVSQHSHHHAANDMLEPPLNEPSPSNQLHDCCQIDCSEQCAPLHFSAVAAANIDQVFLGSAKQVPTDLPSSIHPSFDNTPFRPPIAG